jgi:hypothetical protein
MLRFFFLRLVSKTVGRPARLVNGRGLMAETKSKPPRRAYLPRSAARITRGNMLRQTIMQFQYAIFKNAPCWGASLNAHSTTGGEALSIAEGWQRSAGAGKSTAAIEGRGSERRGGGEIASRRRRKASVTERRASAAVARPRTSSAPVRPAGSPRRLPSGAWSSMPGRERSATPTAGRTGLARPR